MNVIRKWLGALLCMFVVGTLTAEQYAALYSPAIDDDPLAMQEEDGSSSSEESEESSATWGGKKIESGGNGSPESGYAGHQFSAWVSAPMAADQWFAQRFLIRSCSKIHCKEASVLLADRVPHRPYFLLYRHFKYHLVA